MPRAVRGCFSSVVVPRGPAFRDDWQVRDEIASVVDTKASPATNLVLVPSMGKKKWRENGAFFEAQNRHFSFLKWRILNISLWLGRFYVSELFWRPRAQKMAAAIFGPGLFSTSRPVAVAAPDASNLWTCRRHEDTAPVQTATFPWRGVSFYLDASVYAGSRQHNHATH